MNYPNYDEVIVQGRRVKLLGWSKNVKFANPSDIGILKDLKRLREDLQSGACRWVSLTVAEVEEHMAEIEARRAQGEVIGKPRKKRASKKRKTTDENDAEEQPAAKKAKKSKKAKNST